jgi:hypothetical protein
MLSVTEAFAWKKLRKTLEVPSQDSRSAGRFFNLEPSENLGEMQSTRPWPSFLEQTCRQQKASMKHIPVHPVTTTENSAMYLSFLFLVKEQSI